MDKSFHIVMNNSFCCKSFFKHSAIFFFKYAFTDNFSKINFFFITSHTRKNITNRFTCTSIFL